MRKIFRKTGKTSFLRNLFFALLALIMTVTVLLTSVLLTSYHSSIHSLTNRYFSNLLKQCNYSITYMNDLAQRLSSSLFYNHQVISFLNMDKPDSLQTVSTHQAVRNTILPLSYVDSVYLYNRELDLVLCTKSGIQTGLDDFFDQAIAQRLQALAADPAADNLPLVHSVSAGRSAAASVYSYVIPDFDSGSHLVSALVINISVDVLTKSLQELNGNNATAQFAVADLYGTLLVQPSFQTPEEADDLRRTVLHFAQAGAAEGEKVVKIGSTRYMTAFTTANSNDWYIYAMIPCSVIYGDVITTALWSGILVLVLFCLFSYAALRTARRLNRPVEVINQIAQGEIDDNTELEHLIGEEFQTVAAAFARIRQENAESSNYKEVTAKIVRKEFLESLFCGTAVYDQDQCRKHLQSLDCPWIMDQPLIMCLLSIDNYAQFSQENNPREREVLRYAIVNVSTELFGSAFRCEMVEHSADRFIAVLACPEEEEFSATAALLEKKLAEILSVVEKHLRFSLTAAYGTPFTGVSHMARAYENLEELLLLRIRHGYGRVFTPWMADELDQDGFQASSAAENLLISSVVNASAQQAAAQFDHIARSLFLFNPSEIIPYLLHLAYRLLNSVKEADSTIGSQAAKEFKKTAARLPQCEIEADFRSCFSDYLENLCAILAAQKATQEGQNSNALVHRILKMIEANYAREELCLNSIADELSLSAHYVGQIFRAAQGKSVSKYILDLRLEKIAQALRDTDRPFLQIMQDAGFEERQKNYVYTLFKKHFGVTVKAYRQQSSELPPQP